ncbi:PORR domain-containing protein [Cephalotus follicularis]|uniref:PORR domain-containing protein n=1 Tax=Cephalotus follicularis TaxID=3775 RepID=A0A1Q3BMV6_CEPFO|nr:PORR domain-containing protein [Cephalotus follicularis]
MAWRVLISKIPKSKTLTTKFPSLVYNPKPNLSIFSSPFSTSFLITKTPKKYRKKYSKPDSPHTKPVQLWRASIHHIVEFKEEFSLTRQTYQMLKKQPQTFYLAGTEMNWDVFLKVSYDGDGVLIVKDPQVVFNDRLRTYAQMQEGELGYGDDTT